MARGVFTYSEPTGQLAIVIGAPHEKLGTVLDLDFGHEPRGGMSTQVEIMDWLGSAHERVYEAFCRMIDPALLASWR